MHLQWNQEVQECSCIFPSCAGMKEGVMKGDDGESKSGSSFSVLVAETMLIFSLLPMISVLL